MYNPLLEKSSPYGMTEIDPVTLQAKVPFYEQNTGLHPTVKKEGVAAKHKDPFAGYSTPKDTSLGRIDDTIEGGGEQPKYTAEAVKHYANAAAYALKGGADIANGYIGKMSAEIKAKTYDFQAYQNKRAADLLLKNQADITRAAQMDANQYRIAGAETKAKQVSGMAASGFAVGKGIYKNTLNTTDARVNYNVANLMLKADLQNAEITRKSGTLKAQAIIDEANASIARKEGKHAVAMGWLSGISNFISGGASFYCGTVANGDYGKNTPNNTNNTKGK